MLCGLRSVGVLYICAGWAALSPGLRYGENSGDSMHAEPHSRTSCHYQIPWLTRLFSKKRLKRKDFQEVACLPWAQECYQWGRPFGSPTPFLANFRVTDILVPYSRLFRMGRPDSGTPEDREP